MNDDSVGDAVAGSTGNPWTNYCGDAALETASGSSSSLHNIRFCHLNCGFRIYHDEDTGGGSFAGADLQFVHCSSAYDSSDAGYTVFNALFDRVGTIFDLKGKGAVDGPTFSGEHWTVHHCGNFAHDNTGSFYFTNCLFVQTTNFHTAITATMHTNAVVLVNDDTGVFASVGAGNHYLPDNSPYHGIGSSSIDPALINTFSNKTTYAPIVLTNTETIDVTLSPNVQRDIGPNFDIGYHYDPLDYIAWLYTVTNATLTITNGTAVGYYQNAGIWLQDGATIYSQGTPNSPNRFAFYLAVQEQSTTIGTGAAFPVDPYRYGSVGSPGHYRFTSFHRLIAQNNSYDFYLDNANRTYNTLEVRDCAFTGGGKFNLNIPSSISVGVTNTLFEREAITLTNGFSTTFNFSFYNNLLHGGSYASTRTSSSWIVRDNVFYTNLLSEANGTSTHDHNAYINTSTNNFPTNSGDILLSSLAFQTGPLGNYYQPTNSSLIDAGSQYATNAGLFHYTTTTNQAIETNTIVDIGLHYIALDSNGNPLDIDGDGTPDYLEDANGNGIFDVGETDWQSYNSPNGLSASDALRVFTPLK